MDELELLRESLRRESRARTTAERGLEAKTKELHIVNRRLRRIYDHAADGIFVHDQSGNIIDVNRIACEYLGYSRDELLKLTVHDFETLPAEHLRHQWRHFPKGERIQIDGIHRRKDGTTFPVEVRVAQIETVPEPLFLAIARDVTMRVRRRDEIERARKRLRTLASELVLTEAKERQHLAQILHDTIGHDLAVVRMHVQKLGELQLNDTTKSRDHHVVATRIIDEVVQRVRGVTFELSPQTLFELGLPAAVQAIARRISGQQGLTCEVDSEGCWRSVPTDLAILLFYATRELIHNAVKHAQARNIHVQLQRFSSNIAISVIDDGIGFTPNLECEEQHNSFGLFSIRERLAGLSGELSIDSELEMGSRLIIRVPCVEEEREEK